MFLITTVHAIGYCDLIEELSPNHYNFYLINVLSTLQRFSITGFVLISAYFLVDTKETVRKIVSFWMQLLFYSVVVFLFSCIVLPESLSVKYLLKSLFPILSYHYWYPVSYLILLIFAPILNKVIRALSQKQLAAAILLLGFFISVFFHFNPWMDEYAFLGHYSHGLIWFFFLYIVAGYIRLYGVKKPVLLGPVMFLICTILMYAVFVAGRWAAKSGPQYAFIVDFLNAINIQSYNALLPLLMSVSSFVMFLNFKPSVPKWLRGVVTFLVPATFGVYLIQEHNAVRTTLWEWLNFTELAGSPWLIPKMLLTFFCLWVVSVLLYLLYRLGHRLIICKLEKWLTERINSLLAFIKTHVVL
jgi:surface polysaccharide O-acyltransferase-like enzyme